MATLKETKGPTPSGGVAAKIMFFDKDMNPTDEEIATNVRIDELDETGNVIQTTHGTTGR
jgi:hypothetical protein